MTPEELDAIGLSLGVATASTLLSAPLAVAVGVGLSRLRGPWRVLLESLVMAPLVLPPVASGVLLLLLLQGTPLPFTTAAAVLAAAVVAFPLFVRAVRQSVEAVDPGLVEAARTLGASPLHALRTITLPLAAPGIASGALLCFARSLGEFGATVVLAGNIAGQTRTVPLAMYRWLQVPGGEPHALRLVGVSLVLSLAALAGSEWLARRSKP